MHVDGHRLGERGGGVQVLHQCRGLGFRVLQRSLILAIILIYLALVLTMSQQKHQGAEEEGILRERIDL